MGDVPFFRKSGGAIPAREPFFSKAGSATRDGAGLHFERSPARGPSLTAATVGGLDEEAPDYEARRAEQLWDLGQPLCTGPNAAVIDENRPSGRVRHLVFDKEGGAQFVRSALTQMPATALAAIVAVQNHPPLLYPWTFDVSMPGLVCLAHALGREAAADKGVKGKRVAEAALALLKDRVDDSYLDGGSHERSLELAFARGLAGGSVEPNAREALDIAAQRTPWVMTANERQSTWEALFWAEQQSRLNLERRARGEPEVAIDDDLKAAAKRWGIETIPWPD